MIRYVLFDLDETLYPASNGLMSAIGERMRKFIEKKYGLSPQEAHALQKRYWEQYGTTLRGLYIENGLDPREYLAYVHDVDVAQFVHPDPQLRAVLEQIPMTKVIVTNADAAHARRVLERLGVTDQFERIFDIVFMEYVSKPAREAYERVLRALNARGDECILVEDMPRNLTAARELGIRTILVLPPKGTERDKLAALRDPAAERNVSECPPDADLCIPSIYQVAQAIQELAALSAPATVSRS